MRPPNSESTAVGWVKQVPYISELQMLNSVSTARPSPDVWERPSFVQVTLEDSSAGIYSPRRAPVIGVDVWTKDARWDRCIDLAQAIVDECYYNRAIRGVAATTKHYGSKVMTVNPVTQEPIRVLGDASGLAHCKVRLQMFWVPNDGKVYTS